MLQRPRLEREEIVELVYIVHTLTTLPSVAVLAGRTKIAQADASPIKARRASSGLESTSAVGRAVVVELDARCGEYGVWY